MPALKVQAFAIIIIIFKKGEKTIYGNKDFSKCSNST